MTNGQLKSRLEALIKLEGLSSTNPPPDYSFLINRAWEMFAYDSECVAVSEVISLPANTASVQLVNVYKKILDVKSDSTYLVRSSEQFERNVFASFRETTDTLSRWYRPGHDRVGVAGTDPSTHSLTVYGTGYGNVLSADTDIPTCPTVYHDAICYKAASLHMEQFAKGEALVRMANYDQKYSGLVQKLLSITDSGYQRTLSEVA